MCTVLIQCERSIVKNVSRNFPVRTSKQQIKALTMNWVRKMCLFGVFVIHCEELFYCCKCEINVILKTVHTRSYFYILLITLYDLSKEFTQWCLVVFSFFLMNPRRLYRVCLYCLHATLCLTRSNGLPVRPHYRVLVLLTLTTETTNLRASY